MPIEIKISSALVKIYKVCFVTLFVDVLQIPHFFVQKFSTQTDPTGFSDNIDNF